MAGTEISVSRKRLRVCKLGRSYLYFKAPASVSFALPNRMLLSYCHFALRDNNPNLTSGLLGPVTMIGSILAVPLTVNLCKKYDKGQVLFGFLAAYGGVLALAALIPPNLFILYILGFLIGVGMGAYLVVPDAILGDCIDYDELHTGVRSESGYTVVETNLEQFMEVPAYVSHTEVSFCRACGKHNKHKA